MGADLYITPLYEQQQKEWQPRFEKAAEQRDSLPSGSREYHQAQAEVERCFGKMRQVGYFRDPYNDNDLLWKFGLSWWGDVIPMLDKKGRLSVGQTQKLLDLVSEKENAFALNLAKLPSAERRYQRRRYRLLQRFLRQAIELDTPIDTWL